MKKGLLLPAVLLAAVTLCVQASPLNDPQDKAKASAVRTIVTLPPEKASPARIARFENPPVIDGQLNEEIWKSAIVLKDFYQVQPGENIPPSRSTEVLMGYDSKFLYIAFHAFDDPNKVRATFCKRDNVFDDDYVGLYLDTFNDKRKAYVFFFNPLGVQADGIFSEEMDEDYSVDIVMESKGAVTQDGYTVEAAIPFKSLRYEAGKDKPWGIHLFRRIKWINNELNSWMPLARDRSDTLNQAGSIIGLEEISTERSFEIIPSLTLSETGKRIPTRPATADGRFINEPVKFDPGLSLKFAFTPNLVLDLAVNPDFAQVEADQTVVTANQRFPIFFEEKRPFFLEGIDIFQTSLRAVNTRTIVDPDYAAKLTGKRGRNTFGILLASDNAPGNFTKEEREDPDLLPSIAKFLDKNSYIGVIRLKRDVGKESNIGILATSYNFIEKHNNVGGFDGRIRIDPKTILTFEVLGTTSRRFFFDPDLGDRIYRTGNGFGYSWNYDYTNRRFGYFVSGSGRSQDYRADVGFTRRTGINGNTFFFRYSSENNPKAKLISWRVINVLGANYDFKGRMQGWVENVEFNFDFARQTYLGGGFSKGYERVFEEEFGPKRTATRQGSFSGDDPERTASRKNIFLFGGTNPTKQYSLNGFIGYVWGELDFDFGAGPRFPRVSAAALKDPNSPLDPGPGKLFEANLNFTYQPTDALRVSLNYTKNRLTRSDTGRTAFDVNIYSMRATYQFTRFMFARARIDFDSLAANGRGQFLFGWTPNPGTSFFIGYNDDLNVNGFSPFTAERERGFRRNGRTFFIKMSYLIRGKF